MERTKEAQDLHVEQLLDMLTKQVETVRSVAILPPSDLAVDPRRMTVWVYGQVVDDVRLLPHFLSHYRFANQITLCDRQVHGVREIYRDFARAHPKIKCLYQKAGERTPNEVRNACWLPARDNADWAIVVNTDELLWHPNIRAYLAICKARKVTIPLVSGIELVSDKFPEPPLEEAADIFGVPNDLYSKLCVFDPREIVNMKYSAGIGADPVGCVRYDTRRHRWLRIMPSYPITVLQRFVSDIVHRPFAPMQSLKLLHCHFLGADSPAILSEPKVFAQLKKDCSLITT